MRSGAGGITLVEVLFTIALLATLTAIAVPMTTNVVDEMRTAMAARYVSGLILGARISAVSRSAAVALWFQPAAGDYYFTLVVDGNRNGIRAADIRSEIDHQVSTPERLQDKFPGVMFALDGDIPDLDGALSGDRDGVRIGSARILTMTPDGTATSGTLYLRGRKGQYAVRVLGTTGRTRVFQYRIGDHAWVPR